MCIWNKFNNIGYRIKTEYLQSCKLSDQLEGVGNTVHKKMRATLERKRDLLFNTLNEKRQIVKSTTTEKINQLKNKNPIAVEAAKEFIIDGKHDEKSKIFDLLFGKNRFLYKNDGKKSDRNDLFTAIELFKKQKEADSYEPIYSTRL